MHKGSLTRCPAPRPGLPGHRSLAYAHMNGMAFSPDGRLLASCGGAKTVKLWDPATGERRRTLTGHTGFQGCSQGKHRTRHEWIME